MKALSLTQPWATLVAIGAKMQETRGWGTRYRGELAIHAAKRFPADCVRLCVAEQPFQSTLAAAGFDIPADLPRGKVIAVARLIAVDEIDPDYAVAVQGCSLEGLLPPHEIDFGDYTIGRYSWALENVRELSTPVPCRGALGLWDVPADVEQLLRARIAA